MRTISLSPQQADGFSPPPKTTNHPPLPLHTVQGFPEMLLRTKLAYPTLVTKPLFIFVRGSMVQCVCAWIVCKRVRVGDRSRPLTTHSVWMFFYAHVDVCSSKHQSKLIYLSWTPPVLSSDFFPSLECVPRCVTNDCRVNCVRTREKAFWSATIRLKLFRSLIYTSSLD